MIPTDSNYPNRAVFVWLGRGGPDAKYLERWRGAPLSYTPGQPTDATWNTDTYEVFITHNSDGQHFERAADLLMRYQFYPDSIMFHTSDFGLENRWLRAGDRIVQRIHALSILSYPILDGLTMNEIYAVIDEPRRKGFTYVTTQVHSERGEWSPAVEWRDNGDLVLTIHVHSRLVFDPPAFYRSRVRKLQKRAHREGIESFKRQVLAGT
jgi:uncharacterized protein (UPF0548 family)